MTEIKLNKPLDPDYVGVRNKLGQFLETLSGKQVEELRTPDGRVIGFKVKDSQTQEKQMKQSKCDCEKKIQQIISTSSQVYNQMMSASRQIYKQVFDAFVKDDIAAIARQLAKELVNNATVSTNTIGTDDSVDVSAKIVLAQGEQAKSKFWKIWNAGSILESIRTKLLKNPNESRVVLIDTTRSPKCKDGSYSFNVIVDESPEDGFYLDILTNSIDEIDKRIELGAENAGYSCEKVTPTSAAVFSINLSNDDKLTADIYIVYACEKKRYEISSKIGNNITDLFDKLKHDSSAETKTATDVVDEH